jgi:hypothetical protein
LSTSYLNLTIMNLKLATLLGLTFGVTAIAAAPAQAAFSPFSFTTNFTRLGTTPADPINLKSVQHGTHTITNFSLVNAADIIQNGHSEGPSSPDHALNRPKGVCPRVETPTNGDIVAALGNLHLDCIIDTEEKSYSIMDLKFQKSADTVYIWERGRNSSLTVQAILADGSFGDVQTITPPGDDAGFSLLTNEINPQDAPAGQRVSSYGLKYDQNIVGLRVFTNDPSCKNSYNTNNPKCSGPDFKLMAASVPEPGMALGLGVVGGLTWLNRRRKNGAIEK